jgi:hypothetical protein
MKARNPHSEIADEPEAISSCDFAGAGDETDHYYDEETITMGSDQDRERAEKSFRQDVQNPITEYEAQALAIREKTERLKALRLAKEAEDQKSKGRK